MPIRHAATSYNVDPALVKAVVAAESNIVPRAVSAVGAKGLMQLMPQTARAMGVRRPFVPRENIRVGVRYLRSLLDRFDELDHVLAAYNAGPHAVLRYGGVPPIRKPRNTSPESAATTAGTRPTRRPRSHSGNEFRPLSNRFR
jgi:soluble lytic murein transglycosylase-like protein